MANIDDDLEADHRPVPKHIDKSERAAEIALVFAFVFFVVRIPVVLLLSNPTGAETLYLAIAGIVFAFAYHRLTAGQKPGLLLHLGYRAGFAVKGLLPHALSKVVR